MDKNAIKKYAVWARRELIERVAKKAQQYGIEENVSMDANADSINGKVLATSEIKERQALIAQIKDKGYEQVMEEVAYTWFNRFSALRFMEVNGYLPSHVRVFTDEENNFKPQILTEAIHLEMDGLDMNNVYELKEANKTDELYKYLLITQCNALNAILPGMFQKIADYTELLLPDNLLREGSAIEQMISLIPEDDWKDAVQIIGWLYQYYNSEKKDEVFAALKKNVKITKENIPAATQLFTPDWIVRYMVENSLGRLWVEGHPNDELKAGWKYYLDEAEQETDVQAQLDEICEEYKALKPEEIKCIDPCSGSGHILAYMFDVLMQVYEAYGYTSREAVESIVENNIYGLDIDERAAQLANFAVMMKARQYDRRFFARKDEDGNLAIPQPNVYAICESNHISKECLDYFANGDAKLDREIHTLVDEMHDAKEYGSILNITTFDYEAMMKRFNEIEHESTMNFYMLEITNELLPIVKVANTLMQRYDSTITNPPYMSNKGMSSKLSQKVQNKYNDSKNDMFAVYVERCKEYTKNNRYYSMIIQPSFLFLSAFEGLRKKIIFGQKIMSVLHMGRGIFGIDFGSTSFVMKNESGSGYIGTYFKLYQRTFQYIAPDDIAKLYIEAKKNEEFRFNFSKYEFETTDIASTDIEVDTEETVENIETKLKFEFLQDDFEKIPGQPIAYWLSKQATTIMANEKMFSNYANTRAGMITGNNELFVRYWFEVEQNKSSYLCEDRNMAIDSKCKWFPYSKGGEFRKWYGNNDCVVNWYNDGVEMRNKKDSKGKIPAHAFNLEYIFKENICWNSITSKKFSARYTEKGYLYDAGGSFASTNTDMSKYYLGFLNSNVAFYYLSALNPTMNFQKGNVSSIPVILPSDEYKNRILKLVDTCLDLSKNDWDSFEYSWDFMRNPLTRMKTASINEAYEMWSLECDDRFCALQQCEKEINRNFIEIYGLSKELTPNVATNEVTVKKANRNRDIKLFISYAVGCMFGRYSLDKEGLVYAGGEWNDVEYKTFEVDKDNIIPICSDEYFKDDITGRFIKFIETVYGKDNLQSNLQFISDALEGKGTPVEAIRNYFVNDFYNDHCKMYQKRPIYWLFDSGKKGGFKALIYMHRYQQDTIARMRTDYVHEQQGRYRTEITDLETKIASESTSERVKLNKELSSLQDRASEIREYEEKIHHLADQMIRIDFDDGVKNNYSIFQDVLAKIK